MKKTISYTLVVTLIALLCITPLFSASAAVNVPKASDWEPSASKIVATDVEDGVKLSFNNTVWGADVIGTKNAYKLDGLYLHVANMVSGAGNKSLNIAFGKTKNDLSTNAILFLVNNFGASIYKNAGGSETGTPLNMGIGLLTTPNPQQGASILFVKNTDGSFNFFAAGTATIQGTITKQDIISIFGNEDPSVYVTINDNWWGNGNADGNYCIVKELSTGNTNAFTSYCDTWGRDIFASQQGVLEGITFKHFGNHGAHSNLAKKVPLNGLTLKGVTIDYQAMFRFGTVNGTVPDNGFNGEGIMIRVDIDGSVYATCAYGLEPTDKIGTFDAYEKVTIQIVKQPDGSYKVYIVGDVTGKTFVYPVSKDFIEAMYGTDENPMVNIGYSAANNGETSGMKTCTIEKISNNTFDAVAPAEVEAAIAGKVITASVGDKNAEMTYSYKWYSNTTESNQGGTAINGATSETYTIPSGQTAGSYYYYCVVTATSKSGDAESVSTNVIKYVVEVDEPTTTTTGSTGTTTKATDTPKTGSHSMTVGFALLVVASVGALALTKKKA